MNTEKSVVDILKEAGEKLTAAAEELERRAVTIRNLKSDVKELTGDRDSLRAWATALEGQIAQLQADAEIAVETSDGIDEAAAKLDAALNIDVDAAEEEPADDSEPADKDKEDDSDKGA